MKNDVKGEDPKGLGRTEPPGIECTFFLPEGLVFQA